MSVIVKGMEMPKNCYECWLYIEGACYAKGYRDYRAIMDTAKPDDCPLVEIPTPHGRLIDKDKLRRDLFVNFNGERIPFYDCDNYPTKITYRDLHSILAEQKTVIEAEGREE